MARAGLLDVPRHEPRSPGCRRALRFHLEPQFRRPPGTRRAHAPREPGDGGSVCDRGPLRRHQALGLVGDLEQQTVASSDGSLVMRFEIDPFRKYCLLNGLDEIGLTLRHADKIREFEALRKAQHPWYF